MRTVVFKKVIPGCCVALAVIVFIELLLSVLGIVPLMERTDPYVGFSGYSPLFVRQATADAEPIYETAANKIDWFNLQQFSARPNTGVTRIFCVGGSTTYGRPYDDQTSFCGWLRAFLPAVDPNRQWEVINAGGISYASYRVAELMKELAGYEPDLFIVYSGHNEFLEKRTYDRLRNTPKIILNAGALASRLRIYSALYAMAFDEPKRMQDDLLPVEVRAVLDHSVGPEHYHRDDLMRVAEIDHYRNTLKRVVRISKEAGSEIILVTPASNIGDFSPFKSEPAAGMSVSDIESVSSLKSAAADALDAQDYRGALDLAREALALDARDADLLYLQARALRALGQVDLARASFIVARDEDVCPLRAITPFRQVVTDVARRTGSGLVDFAGLVEKHSSDGIPGSEWFLDHVHPTIEGNRQLALALIDEMVLSGFVSPAESWNTESITSISKSVQSSLDEHAHAVALKNLSKVLGWAGKFEEALTLAKRAVLVVPEDAGIHLQLGGLLRLTGEKSGALLEFREAVRLAPWNARAHRSLGLILSELNQMDEARRELLQAIRIDPNLVEAYYDMGYVMHSLGREKQAEAYYRTTLELDSTHSDAYYNLGLILSRRGDIPAAFDAFSQALRLDPDNRDARNVLESIR